jgi:hypothetical protein
MYLLLFKQTFFSAAASTPMLNGLNYFLRALIGKMAVDDKDGMDHARYPEQQRQKDIENKLNGLAAQQYGQRRKDYGQKVSHFELLSAH